MTWCIVVFITCFLQLELPQKDTNFCNSGCLQFCSIPNPNLEWWKYFVDSVPFNWKKFAFDFSKYVNLLWPGLNSSLYKETR